MFRAIYTRTVLALQFACLLETVLLAASVGMSLFGIAPMTKVVLLRITQGCFLVVQL